MLFFFFQAEDGIRELVRSRGLGDVYKRQAQMKIDIERLGLKNVTIDPATLFSFPEGIAGFEAVSYTHLTLPTSDLV